MTTKFANNAFATLSGGISSSTNTIQVTAGQGARFPTLLSTTITVTIASPGVVTWSSHGLSANQAVIFTSTGSLPTGLVAGNVYFVVGASITTNTFQVSTSINGTAVNTTGAQSGVHTGSSDWFWATLTNALAVLEVVRVVVRATDTLTAIRGQDGTTPSAYLTSDRIELRPTAGAMNDKLDVNQANYTFAPLASAVLTGVPVAPTAAPGTNTTQLATTSFVATSFSTVTQAITVANSGADTTPGNLVAKLSAGAGVSLTTLNPTANEQTQIANTLPVQTGAIFDYAGFTIPTAYLACDGSAVLRASFAALFAALAVSTTGNTTVSTNTITNIPSTTGWAAGMPISGAGIPANTLILTIGGSTSITMTQNAGSSNTGGALVVAPWGIGDGSTTFNVPDLRSRSTIGDGTGLATETIVGVTASGNAVTVATNATKWVTGMPVTVSGASVFTGLVNGSYFIVRQSATTISIATTLANAQIGTVIAISGTGNATFTSTWTSRTLGLNGGEEAHAMSLTELLAHAHTATSTGGSVTANTASTAAAGSAGVQGVVSAAGSIGVTVGAQSISTTGGNAAMNNMQPFAVVKKIIKT